MQSTYAALFLFVQVIVCFPLPAFGLMTVQDSREFILRERVPNCVDHRDSGFPLQESAAHLWPRRHINLDDSFTVSTTSTVTSTSPPPSRADINASRRLAALSEHGSTCNMQSTYAALFLFVQVIVCFPLPAFGLMTVQDSREFILRERVPNCVDHRDSGFPLQESAAHLWPRRHINLDDSFTVSTTSTVTSTSPPPSRADINASRRLAALSEHGSTCNMQSTYAALFLFVQVIVCFPLPAFGLMTVQDSREFILRERVPNCVDHRDSGFPLQESAAHLWPRRHINLDDSFTVSTTSTVTSTSPPPSRADINASRRLAALSEHGSTCNMQSTYAALFLFVQTMTAPYEDKLQTPEDAPDHVFPLCLRQLRSEQLLPSAQTEVHAPAAHKGLHPRVKHPSSSQASSVVGVPGGGVPNGSFACPMQNIWCLGAYVYWPRGRRLLVINGGGSGKAPPSRAHPRGSSPSRASPSEEVRNAIPRRHCSLGFARPESRSAPADRNSQTVVTSACTAFPTCGTTPARAQSTCKGSHRLRGRRLRGRQKQKS
ncbi:hypothetical protein ISCGN_004507 [Ixodes scapularis]